MLRLPEELQVLVFSMLGVRELGRVRTAGFKVADSDRCWETVYRRMVCIPLVEFKRYPKLKNSLLSYVYQVFHRSYSTNLRLLEQEHRSVSLCRADEHRLRALDIERECRRLNERLARFQGAVASLPDPIPAPPLVFFSGEMSGDAPPPSRHRLPTSTGTP